MNPRTRGAALLVALLLAATPAAAKAHKVRPGDTFASIAEQQFGDADLGRLLAFHNGGNERARPQPGTRVRLPQARVVRLMLPQRFSDLAERMLNDPSLEELLARLNGKPAPELLPFLEVVVIPAFLELPRVPGETHADVARRVYGPGAPAWPVELANRVPLDHVRVPVVAFFDDDLADEKGVAVEQARARLAPRSAPPKPAEETVARATPAKPPTEEEDRPSSVPAPPEQDRGKTVAADAKLSPANADARRSTAEREREGEATPVARLAEPARRERPAAAGQTEPSPSNSPAGGSVAPREPGTKPAAARQTVPSPIGSPAEGDGSSGEPGAEPAVARQPEPSSPVPAAAAATASLSVPRPAIPEPIPWAPLERVRRAYERGEYHRSEADGHALFAAGNVPPELRPAGWLLVGLAELARGREAQALASFGRARAADPALDLDPFFYPPKVREAFLRADPRGDTSTR